MSYMSRHYLDDETIETTRLTLRRVRLRSYLMGILVGTVFGIFTGAFLIAALAHAAQRGWFNGF